MSMLEADFYPEPDDDDICGECRCIPCVCCAACGEESPCSCPAATEDGDA